MKNNRKTVIIIFVVIAIVILSIVLIPNNKELKGLPTSEFEKKFVEISENGKKEKIKVFFSKWFAPYKSLRKTNYPAITNKYGVYFIRKKSNQEIVYIGFSQSNLYKALYRHFQWYNDSGISEDGRQKRVYYENPMKYEIMIGVCPKKYAGILEKHYIFEYRPKDCEMKYEAYFLNKDSESRLKNPNDIDFWEEIESDVEVPF